MCGYLVIPLVLIFVEIIPAFSKPFHIAGKDKGILWKKNVMPRNGKEVEEIRQKSCEDMMESTDED